jgi:hypothetical protein
MANKIFTWFLIFQLGLSSVWTPRARAGDLLCGQVVSSKPTEPVVAPVAAVANPLEIEKKMTLESDLLLESPEPGPRMNEALYQLFRMSGYTSNLSQLIRDPRKGEFRLGIPVSDKETIELKYSEESRFGEGYYILSKISLVYANQEVVVLSENPVNKSLTDFTSRDLVWNEAIGLGVGRLSQVMVPKFIRGKLLEQFLKWPQRFEAFSASELREMNVGTSYAKIWAKYMTFYVKEFSIKRSQREIFKAVFQVGITLLLAYFLGNSLGFFGKAKSGPTSEVQWSLVEAQKSRLRQLFSFIAPAWESLAPDLSQVLSQFSKESGSKDSLEIVAGYENSQRLVAFYAQKEGQTKGGAIKHHVGPIVELESPKQGLTITELSQTGILIVTDIEMSLDGVQGTLSVVVRRERELELYQLIVASLAEESKLAKEIKVPLQVPSGKEQR